MIIESDYHNHTNASVCAQKSATVETVIHGLERLNFKSIGFCDHYYSDRPANHYIEDIRSKILKVKTKMQVYVGVEVDMFMPGKLDATRQCLSSFDYIMVACPHYQNKKTVCPISWDYTVIAQNSLDYFISAASIPYIDVIVHPFDARGLKDKVTGFELAVMMKKLTQKDYLPIIDLLLKNNIAIELSERLRQQDYYTSLYHFLSLCKESGVRFSLGSDSHAPEHLGSIRKASDAIDSLKIKSNFLWHPSTILRVKSSWEKGTF